MGNETAVCAQGNSLPGSIHAARLQGASLRQNLAPWHRSGSHCSQKVQSQVLQLQEVHFFYYFLLLLATCRQLWGRLENAFKPHVVYHRPVRKAINCSDYCRLRNPVAKLTGEWQLCKSAGEANDAAYPSCREEIMQIIAEIPATLGNHSWGKRKGFWNAAGAPSHWFCWDFCFLRSRGKYFRPVDSGQAQDDDKLCAQWGWKSERLSIANLAFYRRAWEILIDARNEHPASLNTSLIQPLFPG